MSLNYLQKPWLHDHQEGRFSEQFFPPVASLLTFFQLPKQPHHGHGFQSRKKWYNFWFIHNKDEDNMSFYNHTGNCMLRIALLVINKEFTRIPVTFLRNAFFLQWNSLVIEHNETYLLNVNEWKRFLIIQDWYFHFKIKD